MLSDAQRDNFFWQRKKDLCTKNSCYRWNYRKVYLSTHLKKYLNFKIGSVENFTNNFILCFLSSVQIGKLQMYS